MQTEFAVGNGDKIRIVIVCITLKIEEFVPVIGLCGCTVYLVMTDKFNMVDPEITAVCKFPDVVGVKLLIMGDLYIAENDIMSRTVILVIGREVDIIERMSCITADNSLIRLNINFCVIKSVTSVAVFGIASGLADIFCYD